MSSSVKAEDDDDILTKWWCSRDNVQQTKQVSELDSNFNKPSDAACSLTDTASSSHSSQSREKRSVKDLTINSGKNREDDVKYKDLDKPAVESPCKELADCSQHLVLEKNRCQKIPFAGEKVQLIYKKILSNQLEFRADVHVKLDKSLVKISGTDDDVKLAERKLHEVVANFITSSICISETGAKLLSTKIGEDWLDAQLASEQLVAVFFVKDTVPMIMTDSLERLVRVKCIIESLLITKFRRMEQHHTRLLQSAVWNECIENLHSTLLLRISVDYGANMRLVVEGCADALEVALDKLGKMLEENSMISHNVKLRRGVYVVLCFKKSEIQQEARCVAFCFHF